MTRLRSDAWLTGDDEVAMQHRVALRTSGLTVGRGGRPVIGIANSWSDLNPCNLPLRALAGAVRQGIEEAGGIPAEFGTISLGEDLMKPALYRDHVLQAPEGCDLDFLRAPTPAHRRFIEPVVGRT